MSEIEPEGQRLNVQMEKALEVKQAYESEFMAKANVVGVGIGLRQKSGEYTDTVALVVIVERKLGEPDLSPNDILPKEIDEIPVDVQEVGQISA